MIASPLHGIIPCKGDVHVIRKCMEKMSVTLFNLRKGEEAVNKHCLKTVLVTAIFAIGKII